MNMKKRFLKFLFQHVFINAEDDFPWNITQVSRPVANLTNQNGENNTNLPKKTLQRIRSHSLERQNSNSNSVIDFRV